MRLVSDLNNVYTATIKPTEPAKAFVGDDGIYVPSDYDPRYHKVLITKELFVEAYNKWIKSDKHVNYGKDDADCWCE